MNTPSPLATYLGEQLAIRRRTKELLRESEEHRLTEAEFVEKLVTVVESKEIPENPFVTFHTGGYNVTLRFTKSLQEHVDNVSVPLSTFRQIPQTVPVMALIRNVANERGWDVTINSTRLLWFGFGEIRAVVF